MAAHDGGYYRHPRQASTRDLAKRTGLSPSTFQEHLQRGEAHLVEALLPVLRLRASGAVVGEPVETSAAYVRRLRAWVVLQVRDGRIRSLRLQDKPPRDAGKRHPFLTRILQHLRTGRPLDDLPLELEGHGFQAEVLQALREVPPGTTVTYSQLARQLGRPGAARAVGNACATNPFLLVIPCHRVVPAGGGLGGYAGHGGSVTKRRLLDAEVARRPASPAPGRGRGRGGSAAGTP